MNECFRLFVEVVVERLKVRREAREAKTRAEEPKQDSDKGSVNAADATAESTSQPDNGESKAVKPMGEAGSQGKKFLRCIFIYLSFWSPAHWNFLQFLKVKSLPPTRRS